MRFTFTIYNEKDKVYGYVFDMTRAEVQEIVGDFNNESGRHLYYMEGYHEW